MIIQDLTPFRRGLDPDGGLVRTRESRRHERRKQGGVWVGTAQASETARMRGKEHKKMV
jgi:hypothetical protein